MPPFLSEVRMKEIEEVKNPVAIKKKAKVILTQEQLSEFAMLEMKRQVETNAKSKSK
jgi:hypothetical protein